MRFQSKSRIFQYFIKLILCQFCRSAKISYQRNVVSKISSASELLSAQSKILLDVLIQAAEIVFNKKDTLHGIFYFGKILQIFQYFSQLNSFSTIQHHQGFCYGYLYNTEQQFGIFHSAAVSQKIQKGFSVFPLLWSERDGQRHLGSMTTCGFSVIAEVSPWPKARRFMLFEI